MSQSLKTLTGKRPRQLTQELLDQHSYLLRLIARGTESEGVLRVFASQLEELLPGVQICITLGRERQDPLRVVAAPSLPVEFQQLTESIGSRPSEKRLGPAHYGDELHVVDDIATDPSWSEFVEVAKEHQLHSCWSAPIRAVAATSSAARREETQTVGTLALYFKEAVIPTAEDLDILQTAGTMAGLALLAQDIVHAETRKPIADPLTALPGRSELLEQLKALLAALDPQLDRAGVIVIDIDRFREVNETLGYAVGDVLLKKVTERLNSLCGSNDLLARIGDDEFVLFTADVSSTEAVRERATDLLAVLGERYDFSGQQLFSSVSIGASLFPWDGEDAATLLKNAESALYSAKEIGTGRFRLYAPTMGGNVFEKLQLKLSLSTALERNEFELFYQPKVACSDLEIASAEALIRWRHPSFGFVPPADFIPLAEETGLIFRIGEWVLETGCQQIKSWRKAGFRKISLAVNMSPMQFRERKFMDSLAAIVDRAGLAPEALEIEVTESLAMTEVRQSLERLDQIRALGLRIAIDDFGTGYSSLNYLKKFPIDTLKIDQAFIRAIPGSKENQAIVKAVVAMAHYLGFEVVAEGVETPEEVAFLMDSGCTSLQGYYFSRPVPINEFDDLLRQGFDSATGRSFLPRSLVEQPV